MIRFSHVSKRYQNGHEALKDISFLLPAGSFNFLVGHSGAGKTTLMRLIHCSELPSRGHVLVNDRNMAKLSRRDIALHRRKVGIVFQDPQLLHDRTVGENVALPLQVSGHEPREIHRRVRAALDKVGLLKKERSMPVTLSSGEQQRVGIARAVVNRPEVILADEPTGNLDPQLSAEIMQLFDQFNQIGTTVIVATHEYRFVEDSSANIIALNAGEMVFE